MQYNYIKKQEIKKRKAEHNTINRETICLNMLVFII